MADLRLAVEELRGQPLELFARGGAWILLTVEPCVGVQPRV